jgi:glycosyltransferase involved in cell wall biosynthesis
VTLGRVVGGPEKLLVELAKHADRQRGQLQFVSLTTRGALASDIEEQGWPVTALNAPQGLRPGLVWSLARLFSRLRADVVHTHDERPNIYAAPAAKLIGTRRNIHTRHSQGSKLTRRQQWLVRLSAMCNDRFVCISSDSATWAMRQGIPRRKITVLPNGIDLERFAFSGPNSTGPAVLVARLSPEKDIGTLLQASAILLSRRVPNFRLEIAGDGPCRADLERQSATLQLGDRVRFLGVVRDVPGLLARARLFVLSSLTEGISLTLLEAMARGLPVVATRVGGNPEVVIEGETGLLVSSASPTELAQALEQCWSSPDLCARMGKRGRRRVEEHFDIRRMVSQYEAMYRS